MESRSQYEMQPIASITELSKDEVTEFILTIQKKAKLHPCSIFSRFISQLENFYKAYQEDQDTKKSLLNIKNLIGPLSAALKKEELDQLSPVLQQLRTDNNVFLLENHIDTIAHLFQFTTHSSRELDVVHEGSAQQTEQNVLFVKTFDGLLKQLELYDKNLDEINLYKTFQSCKEYLDSSSGIINEDIFQTHLKKLITYTIQALQLRYFVIADLQREGKLQGAIDNPETSDALWCGSQNLDLMLKDLEELSINNNIKLNVEFQKFYMQTALVVAEHYCLVDEERAAYEFLLEAIKYIDNEDENSVTSGSPLAQTVFRKMSQTCLALISQAHDSDEVINLRSKLDETLSNLQQTPLKVFFANKYALACELVEQQPEDTLEMRKDKLEQAEKLYQQLSNLLNEHGLSCVVPSAVNEWTLKLVELRTLILDESSKVKQDELRASIVNGLPSLSNAITLGKHPIFASVDDHQSKKQKQEEPEEEKKIETDEEKKSTEDNQSIFKLD